MISRKRSLAATAALAALGLMFVGPADAARTKAKKADLEAPEHSLDQDAFGRIKLKENDRGTKITVKVKRLDPKTDYELRIVETDEVLDTVTTDRKGKGKIKLNSRKDPLVDEVDFPSDVEVFEVRGGECVLRVETDRKPVVDEPQPDPVPDDEPVLGPAEGHAEHVGANDEFAFSWILSAPDAELECFAVTLMLPSDEAPDDHGFCPAGEVHEFFADSVAGDEMPLGVDRASDLAERDFEIRDGAGNTVIADKLPTVKELPPWMARSFDDMMPPPDVEPLPMPEFEFDESEYELWIADGDGVLTKVGNFVTFDFDALFDFDDEPQQGGDDPGNDRRR